jgi:arylsulfatase A-like enzyme
MYKYISLSLLCSTAITAQVKKPNILFILTDQQSSTMMSCAGNNKLSTPAMDKIAANGVRFTKAYSANPVSLPSRFALFTGHFASEVGVRYNDGIANKDSVAGICARGTLGSVFRDAGYQTLYGGKIHLPWANTKSLQARMSETYGFSNYFTSDERGELANQTAQFLSNYKATDKPFLMVVSLINPHDICYFWDNKMYDETRPASIPEDSWFYVKDMINKKNAMSEEAYKAQLPPFPVNHAQMTNAPALDTYQKFTDRTKLDFYNWSYHRLTEVVDSEIDIVLKTLEKSAAKENTILVFTSDHGDMNGAHQLVMKSRIYDEASKIPFVFSGPGIKKNVIDSETIVNNGLDMIPTLCDLAGIARPLGLIGESLKSQLKDTNPVPLNRQYMFFETAIAYVCMDNQYKYALYDGKGTTEVLLDMINDPKETTNIAQLSKHKSVRERMNKALTDYMKSKNLVLNPDVTKMPKAGDELPSSLSPLKLRRKVYVNQGNIIIPDIETKISVSAYNLNGMMLWRATTQDRTFTSPSMSKGIYFLYIEENRNQVGQVILID